jgi:nucleoside-diphosphate-sugar epimerase/sugar phosphate isomerase/epimerase
MSTGSEAITLLKAAPEPDQIADRLEGGPWSGLELCLAPSHVESDQALERATQAVQDGVGGTDLRITAEAPVAWPSGNFVRVDRLDDEARQGIERSAAFAEAIASPVLTIHLFAPRTPHEFERARSGDGPEVDEQEVERFLRFYAEACRARGVKPLIENVPPVLRMRTGGVYLSPVGGHWKDLLEWRERVPELGFTIDTSHAALFRSFAAAYPGLFGLASDEGLDLPRYVEELGPAAEVAHISDAHGILGEGLPYGVGELDLEPVVRRLGELVPFLVAEINEPDPARSGDMKAGYRAIEAALGSPGYGPLERPGPRLQPEPFDWQAVLERSDPVPDVLALQELVGGRRVLMTGGGGSIAGALATLLLGFRPERITLMDSHEASLTADRRARQPEALERMDHVLCDIRDGGRLEAELVRARPHLVFHFAAYKHVDWAEIYPDEFLDTNLHGSWNLLRAAELTGVDTVVVASTDKAALAASFYGRTKRFMEQLTAFSARSRRARRIAVRFVNVLGTAGSASELFLRQARARVPLTVTDTGMVRFWITMAQAATLAAHGALLAGDDAILASVADPSELTVGDLAKRIWRRAGREGEPQIELTGIRRGETMSEVITGPGEEIGEERRRGIVPILGDEGTAAAAWIAERLRPDAGREEARPLWREAMERPGLLAPRPKSVRRTP